MKLLYQIVLYSLVSFASLSASIPTFINLSESTSISPALFESLEELARIVDISYCVGSTGIYKPFTCASRCDEFEGFELIDSWKTGVLMSDSCGYIALSHPPFAKRIIVAFRGTYSIANTVVDLSTAPAEYLPYPSDEDEDTCLTTGSNMNAQQPLKKPSVPDSSSHSNQEDDEPCMNCTAHAGFLTAWKNTRCVILPLIEKAKDQHPDYQLTLVGHSLGGAVAALASLEFLGRGWEPQVTTFGEPRVGNQALVDYFDRKFKMNDQESKERTYRRVTHASDPVPLLPLDEWGYKMHAGEIYISKKDLSPERSDLRHCSGDEDGKCIAGTEYDASSGLGVFSSREEMLAELSYAMEHKGETMDRLRAAAAMDWRIPNRYRLWELFFAHRDYFWRLGLCLPKHGWWSAPSQDGEYDDHDQGMFMEQQEGLEHTNDDTKLEL